MLAEELIGIYDTHSIRISFPWQRQFWDEHINILWSISFTSSHPYIAAVINNSYQHLSWWIIRIFKFKYCVHFELWSPSFRLVEGGIACCRSIEQFSYDTNISSAKELNNSVLYTVSAYFAGLRFNCQDMRLQISASELSEGQEILVTMICGILHLKVRLDHRVYFVPTQSSS